MITTTPTQTTWTEIIFEVDEVDDIIVVKVGEPGPPGADGSGGPGGGGSSFVFSQSGPSAEWTIFHELGYRPAVSTFGVGGEIEGEVVHDSVDQARVLFDVAVSGTAYLS